MLIYMCLLTITCLHNKAAVVTKILVNLALRLGPGGVLARHAGRPYSLFLFQILFRHTAGLPRMYITIL